MIDTETVFILGAGASVPYGYPSGGKLRMEICDNSVTASSFIDLLKTESTVGIDTSSSNHFVDIFFRADESIDFFLSKNPEFSDVGKIAIVYRILEAERNSKFREETNIEGQNWYSILLDRMRKDLTKSDDYQAFGENKVSFITFNYDRSLEHYLFDTLMASFYEKAKESYHRKRIVDQINCIPIIHVYGKIGNLNWQGSKHEYVYDYGFDYNINHIRQMANNIKVISETRNTENKDITDLINNAKRIFFLGFGYAPENMALLEIPNILGRGQSIYGTAYNYTEREIERICNTFWENPEFQDTQPIKYNDNLHFVNCDCLTLLREYL